ncbi:MAG: NAD-dependent deacylase [Myxococcales bacterium]|nr:NAD-dependent deacylase [Myxococcales bacterium]
MVNSSTARPEWDVVRELIRGRGPLTVLTGAGASAESGVPTFRGAGGLWRERDVMSLATPEAFREDPRLVWEFYQYRRREVATCAPNDGHLALARHQSRHADTWIITQNVDGLNRAAGSTERLIEMHGSLWWTRCTSCGLRVYNDDLGFDTPPRCSACCGMVRPDIVWFGEGFHEGVIESIVALLARGGTMLIVGTSGAVYPAAGFAAAARAQGAVTVEINLEASFIADDMDYVLRAPSGEVLPYLLTEP